MRGLVLLLSAVFAATMLTQSVAQGAPAEPAAKGKVTIKVPSDGNATVAHIVLNGQVKKGKKPKAPAKRPKLKVSKAPKGVVVAASYKRDKKKKNRWHATVAVTNPLGGPVARSASSSAQDEVIVIEGVDTDGNYVIIIAGPPDIIDEIVGDQTEAQEAIARTWIDPAGSSGDAYLFGMAPGVSANDFLGYNRMLATDGPTTSEDFGELGLGGPVVICSPFPGNPMEAFCDFTIFSGPPVRRSAASRSRAAAPVNGIALQFPGAQVVAQLPPAGFGGVITPNTVTWGNKNVPFTSGQTYRGNVRLNVPFTPNTEIKALITTTGGPPYTGPFPGNFVP
jgi:hypothetical protein